jgi:type IV pilus assembly protein PilW
VAQIYLSSKQAYRVQEALARVQENGRIAMEFLTKDIRMAGFQGCANIEMIVPRIIVDPPSSVDFTPGRVAFGYEGSSSSWNPSLPPSVNNVVADTDVLTLQHASDCGAQLTGNMTADNANIQLASAQSCGFEAGDVLIISDCLNADIFKATSVSHGSGTITIAHANNMNIDNRLSKAYPTDAQLFQLDSVTYFIRDADGTGPRRPGLWRLENDEPTGGDNPMELVEGVVNMQVLYGEDMDNDNTTNRYVPANAPPNMSNLASIRMELLLETFDDNLTPQPQPYTFNGSTITPSDRRLRRVFATDINLRNKTP